MKLGLIHTSATLVPVFQELCRKHLPDVKTFNIVDDSLVQNILASGGSLTPSIARQVVTYVGQAQQSGADFVLVTCSSIGRAVEASAALTQIPVLRVDQPMADEAVKIGRKIGVIATLSSTLEPTSDLIERRAALANKEIELQSVLCEGAFEALIGGNAALHDEIVANALKKLSNEVEVIVLAQASMARVVGTLSETDKKVPILASPEIAIEHLAKIL